MQSNISGETWKCLSSDGPHPAWQSLRRSAEKNGRQARFAKLGTSYPKKLEAVITAKGASTKYWVMDLNTYANVIFQFFFFNKFAEIDKILCLFRKTSLMTKQSLGGDQLIDGCHSPHFCILGDLIFPV